MGQGFWENGCAVPPFFEAGRYLGSIKACISHGDWRSYFFPKISFPKIRVHLDLHIYHWNFSFIKK
jgi:hypothetical protein